MPGQPAADDDDPVRRSAAPRPGGVLNAGRHRDRRGVDRAQVGQGLGVVQDVADPQTGIVVEHEALHHPQQPPGLEAGRLREGGRARW